MTNDKGILIKNIYYMLSYAFQILKQGDYEKVAAEKFDKINDLFAAILVKGVSRQLKQDHVAVRNLPVNMMTFPKIISIIRYSKQLYIVLSIQKMLTNNKFMI